MNLLIDTHILLWLLFSPKKIDKHKLQALRNSQNSIYICSISFWEISLKYSLGKLELNNISPDKLPDLTKKMGIKITQMTTDELSSFYKLPRSPKHKDPFDRAIIWHSISNNYSLVSQDSKFKEYEKYGLKQSK